MSKTLRLLETLEERPGYGAELSRRSGVAIGSVYKLLLDHAGRGHVRSEQEHDETRSGKPRRFWRLTPEGALYLRQERAAEAARESVLTEAER